MLYPDSVKYWLWSLYKWWHGSWVVHDLFRVQSEAMRVSPDQIWTARLLGWVIMISPCHTLVTSHQDTETQEKTDPEVKFVWRHILLNLLFVVVLSWVKKFSLTPGTGFLFHGIDMKSEASGIPISHNNRPAAKPSHEVLSPNRNNPRPFILIRPVVAQPTCRQSGNIVQWPHGNCTAMYRSEWHSSADCQTLPPTWWWMVSIKDGNCLLTCPNPGPLTLSSLMSSKLLTVLSCSIAA